MAAMNAVTDRSPYDFFPADRPRVNYLINWSRKHKLIYVETPKVGCTTIKKVLQYSELDFDASLMPQDVHLRRESPLLSPRHDEVGFLEAMFSPEYLMFAFVRNPFTRVLSAYLDKIVSKKQLTPRHEKLGIGSLDDLPTFGEFIDLISDERFLLMDAHWAPQTHLLGFENVRYDFIGRFEYFDESISDLISRRNLRIPPGVSAAGRVHATGADSRITEHYTDSIVTRVRSLYEDDFRYLGYGWSC